MADIFLWHNLGQRQPPKVRNGSPTRIHWLNQAFDTHCKRIHCNQPFDTHYKLIVTNPLRRNTVNPFKRIVTNPLKCFPSQALLLNAMAGGQTGFSAKIWFSDVSSPLTAHTSWLLNTVKKLKKKTGLWSIWFSDVVRCFRRTRLHPRQAFLQSGFR